MSILELKQDIAETKARLAISCGADACKVACALLALQDQLIKELTALEAQSAAQSTATN